MPFLQTDEELDKQNSSGQISGPSAGPMSSAAPKKAGSPASSGTWVNLQQYVNANKDQANKMGEAVVGTADTAGQEAQQATQNFQAKVPQKTQQYSAQDLESQYYANPNADKSSYQNIKTTGGYTGPKSLEEAGYGAAESAVNKANERLGNLQTEQGRQQVLGDVYGKPSYTGGQKTFDNLLLQNTSGVQNKVAEAQNRWGGLTNMLSGAKTAASEVIPQNIATAAQNSQTAVKAEQDYVNNLYNTIESGAATKNTDNQQQIDTITNNVKSGRYTPEMLAMLGLKSGANIYDINVGDYLNPSYEATHLTANQAASPEQRAAWSNLMNLIGGSDQRISATGSDTPAITANKQGLAEAIAAKAPTMNAEIETLSNKTYGGGQGGGFEISPSGSMNEMLNMGLTPKEYYNYKNKYTSRGFGDDALAQLQQDYDRLMSINKKASSSTNNVIKRGGTTITGGLKG